MDKKYNRYHLYAIFIVALCFIGYFSIFLPLFCNPKDLVVKITNHHKETISNLVLDPRRSKYHLSIIDKLGPMETEAIKLNYGVSVLDFQCEIGENQSIKWESEYLEKYRGLTIVLTITENGGIKAEYKEKIYCFP